MSDPTLRDLVRLRARPLTPLADHILEYENYAGFDKAWEKIRGSEVRRAH